MRWKIALPMYNLTPVQRADYDRLIDGVVEQLREQGWRDEVEVVAATGELPTFWRQPDVLLTQTCGYPLIAYLHNQVQVVATPCFTVTGCSGTDYSSALIVPANSDLQTLADCRGKRAAVNQVDSNSGMNALRHAVAPLSEQGRFFGEVVYTGAHRLSLERVAEGQSDLAAIDAVTFTYAQEQLPELTSRVRVIGYTASAPGLPMIASRRVPAEVVGLLQQSLDRLVESMPEVLARLHIKGFERLGFDAYQRVVALQEEAFRSGYATVA